MPNSKRIGRRHRAQVAGRRDPARSNDARWGGIRRDRRALVGVGRAVLGESLLGVTLDQLGRLARAREGEHLAVGLHRFLHPVHRVVVGGASSERVDAQRRRIPQERSTFAHAANRRRRSLAARDRSRRPTSSPGLAIVALVDKKTGLLP